MSLAEFEIEIEKLTDAEREQLIGFLAERRARSSPEWLAELGQRLDRVQAGHYYTQEDLERVHAERVAEGR